MECRQLDRRGDRLLHDRSDRGDSPGRARAHVNQRARLHELDHGVCVGSAGREVRAPGFPEIRATRDGRALAVGCAPDRQTRSVVELSSIEHEVRALAWRWLASYEHQCKDRGGGPGTEWIWGTALFSPVAARYDGGGAGGRLRACGKDGVHLCEVGSGFGFFLA